MLSNGTVGKCHVRADRNGRVRLLSYGLISSLSVGPVEKKLYHFLPSSLVLSVGSFGCNMSCSYCQNNNISQLMGTGTFMSASRLVRMALKKGVKSIAFTHSEPTIWYEYVLNAARLARSVGLKSILKTNGYVIPGVFKKLCKVIDAVDMDIKGDNNTYHDVCGAGLGPVLQNMKIASSACHLEISYPMMLGDDIDSVIRMTRRHAGDVPMKILKIVPGGPSPEELKEVRTRTSLLFSHVYLHVPTEDNDTFCKCGDKLVSRKGIQACVMYTKDGRCSKCNTEVPIYHEV
jgi:pyruvate formate lyase activating enzyme